MKKFFREIAQQIPKCSILFMCFHGKIIFSGHKIPQQVTIQDKPTYPYRGILLDTGRNYYSVDSIKRVIDAMSYNKLNVLHWHMNEQQSFPFVSERVPNLTRFGAYSQE